MAVFVRQRESEIFENVKRNHYNSCTRLLAWELSELAVVNDNTWDLCPRVSKLEIKGVKKCGSMIPSTFRDDTYFVSPIYANVDLRTRQTETAIKVAKTPRPFCSCSL